MFIQFKGTTECGKNTNFDEEGPLFLADVPWRSRIAPEEELRDPSKARKLEGTVWDSNCLGIEGATVHIWYAGGKNSEGENSHIT